MSWSPFLDFRFYVVLGLGLAGLLALAQRLARAPSARTMGLVALRGLILSILIVILLNPIRTERELRPGPAPSAIFLLDGSRSMGLEAQTRVARLGPARSSVPDRSCPGTVSREFSRTGSAKRWKLWRSRSACRCRNPGTTRPG